MLKTESSGIFMEISKDEENSNEEQSCPKYLTDHAGISLERRSSILRSGLYILGFLIFEITKQIGNFSLTTTNNNKYPIPTPLLIVLIEAMKLGIIAVYLQITRVKTGYKVQGFSIKFIIPAICYFITNFLYFYALTITAPPIWIILIQTRILYTALIYKVKFGKPVTTVQIVGCVLIVCSIVLTRFSEIYHGRVTIDLSLLVISQVSSILSSVACLAVELLLKNDIRSFSEQQFWLYFWGVCLGLVAFHIHPQTSSTSILQIVKNIDLEKSSGYIISLVIFSICASSLAGLCVPCILRNLDSIVKDYLIALNNILLAYLIAIIFPHHFQVNYIYGISLILLLIGIIFYERKTKESVISLVKFC